MSAKTIRSAIADNEVADIFPKPVVGVSTRYRVRKQSSGYTFNETFYVYDLERHGRVSVHAGTRESAQADADALNVGDMVRDHAEDPRPYAERRAEAVAAFTAATGRIVR